MEDDVAGRLAGFRARFGRGFDAGREHTPSTESAATTEARSKKTEEKEQAVDAGLEDNGFSRAIPGKKSSMQELVTIIE